MALIRGGIFFVFMTMITALYAIVFAPTLIFGEAGARFTAKLWSRTVLLGVHYICGVRDRAVSDRALPTGPALIAANHQSMWETLYLFANLDKPVFVLKQELLHVPIFGWWLIRTGAIAVDRKAGAKALRKMTADAERVLAAGSQIVIFPEGTRTAVGARSQLQPGVAALYKIASTPCTPIVHDSGRYWLHPGPAKRSGEIKFDVRDPIPAGLDRRAFMSALDAAFTNNRPDLNIARDDARHTAPPLEKAQA